MSSKEKNKQKVNKTEGKDDKTKGTELPSKVAQL